MKRIQIKPAGCVKVAVLFFLSSMTGGIINAQQTGQEGRPSKDTLKTGDIQEVVVTAYGIKREKKALGYVYQDIKGTTLVDARENNITNALIGKVSGLEVVKSAAGPAASSKIILRGFNSLTGDNQPLIVVDGVPMSNFIGASNNDFWNPSADMGNGLSDLSPEDIDNVTVLKGGAASALYGSRAGNGVILITTKTGRGARGAGITLSETLGYSDLMVVPRTQKVFGQGSNGVFPVFNDQASGSSWGPKIDGQEVVNWNGETIKLDKTYDNVKSFFRAGETKTHTVTIQNQLGGGTSIFTSASYMTDKGVVPGADYNRLNLTTRVTSKFGLDKKWSTDVKVQYINSLANNRPIGGQTSGANYYRTVLTMPNTLNIADFQKGMDVQGAAPYWWLPGSGGNPYWMITNSTNNDVRNRFLMNGMVKYAFTDWLDADIRIGTDMYSTKTENKSYYAGPLTPISNSYGTGFDRFHENNYIASLNAHKDNIVGKWSASMSVFGQVMQRKSQSLSYGGTLRVPNYFSVGNIIQNGGNAGEGFSKQQINSVFSTAEISYDGFWFINGTGRFDWSSTLSPANREFFYPSVSTSLVLTDMFRKLFNMNPSRVLTFLKLRGSYAVTGNSLPPYSLSNVYSIGTGANGSITAGQFSQTKFDPNVVAEKLRTYETGLNARFFNRVDLDVNYYDTHATNQLLSIPLNPLSGYNGMMVNAGDIQNKGLEVTLNADVFRGQDFTWNMLVNYSANRNKIISLYPGVSAFFLGGYDSLSFQANPGGFYGSIWGSSYQRVDDPNSQYNGKIIVDKTGLPMANNVPKLLGDQTSRGLLGVTNSFKYKEFGLSFQVDGRFGGQFFSGTERTLDAVGLGKATVVNGARENFVVDGVVADGNGGFAQNTEEVTPQNYWAAVTARGGNLGINEAFLHSATNVRLRNIQLTYSLPKSLLERTPLQAVKASFSINNVFMIYSAVKGVDPEAVYATGSNAIGFENMNMPSYRTFLFNLSVSF